MNSSNSAKRILLLTLKIFLAFTLFLLVLGISALLFIRTDSGHEFTRKQINQLISGQIRGKFEIKHLDEIAFNHITGRDLVITAPNGEKVIELNKIFMTPVWRKLLVGKIAASSATVTGGVFRINETTPSLSIIQALNAPVKKNKGTPIPILFENVEAKNLEVQINVQKFPAFTIKNINTLVRFESANRRVIVTLAKTNGEADFPVLGATKISQLSGQIKSKMVEVMNFKLKLEFADLVPAHITYLVPKNEKKQGDPKMVILFSKENPPSFFPKLVLNAADTFTSLIEVGFE